MTLAVVILVILAAFYGLLHLGTEMADFVMTHKWHWSKWHW
jgi:hypothetical protein